MNRSIDRELVFFLFPYQLWDFLLNFFDTTCSSCFHCVLQVQFETGVVLTEFWRICRAFKRSASYFAFVSSMWINWQLTVRVTWRLKYSKVKKKGNLCIILVMKINNLFPEQSVTYIHERMKGVGWFINSFSNNKH